MGNFGIYFWVLVIASLVLGVAAKADCPDCGTHPYYGGK